jgi:aerobic-type carbon monoxide dehydrogenase small subunit (CoxS/CutS family)
MGSKANIELKINGEVYEVAVEPKMTLLQVLRDVLGLTGAKEGCSGLGECGTCTVLMEGRAVLSCLILAIAAVGKDIVTIEGLAGENEIHPLQKSFIEHGAIQCCFCTPGMILSAKALLDRNPRPTEREVRRAISGNLCRCTGYAKIVEAVLATNLKSPCNEV